MDLDIFIKKVFLLFLFNFNLIPALLITSLLLVKFTPCVHELMRTSYRLVVKLT